MDRITCPKCGEEHDLHEMDVGYNRPDAFFAVPAAERDQRCRLTDDLGDIDGETYFVRGVLMIPVIGEANTFGWGVWARVPADSFRRYVSTFSDENQADEPPFQGWIATQLPGYPQTLGLPLSVHLTGGKTRPLFSVTDFSHPLGREQRDGIYLERVLEMLSPFIHANAAEPVGRPAFATIERAGWQLESPRDLYWARDQIYWFPSAAVTNGLTPGAVMVKLLFRIEASDARGQPYRHIERMWVSLDHRKENEVATVLYSGLLENGPLVPGLLKPGMRVWFTPEHVLDFGYDEETQASRHSDVLQCHHGPSFPNYVCQHLVRGRDLGFHQADDTDTPRPDAWCDACNLAFLAEGEWNERAEANLGVTLVCGGCYDNIESRNRPRGA